MLVVAAGTFAGAVAARAEGNAASPHACISIEDNEARLSCIKNQLFGQTRPAAPSGDAWPIVRSKDPGSGRFVNSIARSPDLSASDPDLAGLIIRCAPPNRLEMLIALIAPVPIRAKRTVRLGPPGMPVNFEAESILPGTLLLLPPEAAAAISSWENRDALLVEVQAPAGAIKGQIPLAGLSAARQRLAAACLTQD